jgi:hypothetical protein
MNKIWVWSLLGFGLVAAAGIATLITIWFMADFSFDEEFKFGAASSSYQIEGAWDQGQKSKTIWDTMVQDQPERIAGGANGNEAANSYILFKEDVKAVKDTGVSALDRKLESCD